MMMWSCTVMPSGCATSAICRVIWTSAVEGEGSPEGWLWTRMMRGRRMLQRALDDLARIDRRVVDGALLLHLVGDQPVLLVEKEDAELLVVLERHRRAAIVDQLPTMS